VLHGFVILGGVDTELARQQWNDGNRRVEAARAERRRYVELQRQIEIVVRELRHRVGQIFTLDELAGAYDSADRWAREAIDLADPEAPPAVEAGTVADAAFHHYARGASDYRP
jgi:hypothetical protein